MPEWEKVALGEVVTPVQRSIEVTAGVSYRTIGVRWWGGGAYERQTIDGSQTAAKTLFIVHKDDLIINKIWVRHGSTAIAGQEVHGCAASNEFPTFELDMSRVTPEWLHYLTQTREFWTSCDALSQGTSGKNRIKPEKFLTIEIPLPPLPEQRRIVARVQGLLAKVEEARGLREEVMAQLDAYSRSVQAASKTQATPIRELVQLRSPDVMVAPDSMYHFAGVYSFGRGIFVGQKKQGQEFAYPKLTRLRTNDFTYPKLMAWEGAFGLVPTECDGLVVSTEYPVFEIDTHKIQPEVLDSYFKNPKIWPAIAGESTGTNARRRRLNPTDFLNYLFPLPSMEDQRKIAQASKVARQVQAIHAETQTQIEALPSSILARAFAGAL